jgi:hypothetical protein
VTTLSFAHRYPVFVQGRSPKNKTFRGAVIIRQARIDVEAVTSSEAPVAVTIKTQLNLMGRNTLVKMDFRHHEGSFYTQSQFSLEDLHGVFAAPFTSIGIGNAVIEDARRLARGDCWPKGIIDQFDDPHKPIPAGDLCLRDSHLIEIAPDQEGYLRSQDEKAMGISGQFIVIDGQIWERSPEPAYKLSVKDGAISIVTDEVSGPVVAKAEKYAGNAHFSLLDLDLALETFRKFHGRLEANLPDVDIRMPEAFETDYATVNFIGFARCLSESVGFHSNKAGTFAERLKELRREVKEIPVSEVDIDAVERIVTAVVDDDQRFGIFSGVPKLAIKQHMDLWESRPVDLHGLESRIPRY